LYASPCDTDAHVLYYNKKLFKEAGLDPNKPPRTISELDDGSSDCIDCTYNNFLLLCAKLFSGNPTGKPVAPFHISSPARRPSGEFYIHPRVNPWYSALRIKRIKKG